MTWLLVMPIVLPLLVAGIATMLWRSRRAQRAVSFAGFLGLLGFSVALFVAVYTHGVQAVQMGGYAAPFGITIVADLFSAILVMAASVMGVAIGIYSIGNIDHSREVFGYHPLMHILLMGVCGAFLTGDMFNLYVFFEIMLLSSFVLLTLGGERGQMEGAIKYVTLNLMSSAIFLAGVGILYGLTGTLNMADLAVKFTEEDAPIMTVLAMMFLVAFGVKAAMFPLFFWLPASYHTPPPAVSAIFAALLTKVGVYSIMRVFTLIFTYDIGYTHVIVLVAAGFGMICGVLGAATQNEFRRILAFHSVSQIGYMLMGLGLVSTLARSDTPEMRAAAQLALAGAIVFIVHHLIVKPNLFLASGFVERLSGTGHLKKLGGYYRDYPFFSLMFLISALSLAGIPPLSGFWAKLVLVKAGLQMEQYLIVAAALVTGLLTLFSMVKIWAAVFWADAPKDSALNDAAHVKSADRWRMATLVPIGAIAGLVVVFGVAIGPVFNVAMEAADQLMNPEIYIRAVLPPAETEFVAEELLP